MPAAGRRPAAQGPSGAVGREHRLVEVGVAGHLTRPDRRRTERSPARRRLSRGGPGAPAPASSRGAGAQNCPRGALTSQVGTSLRIQDGSARPFGRGSRFRRAGGTFREFVPAIEAAPVVGV